MATVRIQIRRGTAAEWTSANPTLAAGEVGLETDTRKIKFGDGSTAWTSLSYLNPGDIDELSQDAVNAALTMGSGLSKAYDDNGNTITLSLDTGVVATLTGAQTFTDKTISGNFNTISVHGKLASVWTADNPVLAGGELGLESDTGKIKVGDGVTAWNSISSYINVLPSQLVTTNVSEGTNLYFTNERAQDAVGNSLGSGLSYNDSTGEISVDTSAIQARVTDVSDTEIGYLNGVTSGIQSQIDGKLNTSGGTLTGALTLNADPTQALHAATKQYVDNASEGLLTKPSVDVATTANLSATYNNGTAGVGATLTYTAASLDIDGKTSWSVGDSVLFKNQTNPAENGRYVVTAADDLLGEWTFTRCGLCDEADEIPGAYMFVLDGTTNAQTSWVLHVDDPATFTVGTDDIDAYQFSGAGTYNAGNGLTLSGNSFSINTGVTVDLSTAQTLTNKTLTSPVISSISNTGTITLPSSTDTLVGRATTDTLTNKTINLTDNTLSGTTAQFNTALSDADFVVSESGAITTVGTLNLNAASPTIASNNASAASIFTSTVTGVTLGSSSIKSTLFPADGTTSTGAAGAGYMGMPQVSTSTSRNFAATDAGKHIYVTATGQTLTIPANSAVAFPVGTTISIINANGVSTTISINTDTMRLANSSSTGNRTLASNGFATLVKVNSTEWVIGGNGLS